MTSEAIARVQASFEAIRSQGVPLAARFYQRFFKEDPRVRSYFPETLTLQQAHFEAALAMIVKNLSEVEVLAPALRDLGAQHLKWGAEPQHYFAAREALVAAIRDFSGGQADDQLDRDWREAITVACSLMLEGAAVETAVAAEKLKASIASK